MIFDRWIDKASRVKISIYKIVLSFTIKYTHKNIQKKNINVQEKYTVHIPAKIFNSPLAHSFQPLNRKPNSSIPKFRLIKLFSFFIFPYRNYSQLPGEFLSNYAISPVDSRPLNQRNDSNQMHAPSTGTRILFGVAYAPFPTVQSGRLAGGT